MELLIGIILFILFFYYSLKPKDIGLGFKTFRVGSQHGVQKQYGTTQVKIFHWGSNDWTADGNDSYLGIYCLISTSKEVSLPNARILFEDFSIENFEGRFFITMHKKKLFLGNTEMKEFLQNLDKALHLVL